MHGYCSWVFMLLFLSGILIAHHTAALDLDVGDSAVSVSGGTADAASPLMMTLRLSMAVVSSFSLAVLSRGGCICDAQVTMGLTAFPCGTRYSGDVLALLHL